LALEDCKSRAVTNKSELPVGINNPRVFWLAASSFEAACSVDIFPEGHPARGLHGHSYVAKLRCDSSIGFNDHFQSLSQIVNLLGTVTDRLNYSFLNETINIPTDENIARWVLSELDVEGVDRLGVQSTPCEGVDIDLNGEAHVWKKFQFESAHFLPNVPVGHKCGRMHGHGFQVLLHTRNAIEDRNYGIEYERLSECWKGLHDQLHRRCLNDIEGLENPTSELIAEWIWRQVKSEVPELSWVTVYETASSGAHYDGELFRIWKDFSIDSAVQLEEDGDSRVFGHTFLSRLHLTSDIDRLLGWTMDYGDVKEKFSPIFNQIDHRPLYEIHGLENSDAYSIANWIKQALSESLPELDRIDLYETRGCGVTLDWGQRGPALPV